MRIADNRPTIAWIFVTKKQKSKYYKDTFTANTDWFISSLLANYKQYNLDDSSKSQLIYYIYLLLNKDFQNFLSRLRTLLDIPKDGFNDTSGFHKWETNISQSQIIEYLESKTGNTKPINTNTKQYDPADELLHGIIKDIGIARPFYSQWLLFMRSILYVPDPKLFLDTLSRHIQEEKLIIENGKIGIALTRKSTINSIRETITKNKDDINQAIEEVKERSKETALEVENLERDFSIYKIYTNYSASDNKECSERKEDKVNEKIRLKSTKNPGDDFNDGSIRNIVSKMNKRIHSTFNDKQQSFNSVLDKLEHSR